MRSTLPPAGWQSLRLDRLASINVETVRVGTALDSRFDYIDIGSASNGEVDWDTVTQQVLRSAPSRARRLVREGDVLFGTVRPANQSHGFVLSRAQRLIASTGFAAIRAIEGVSHPRFLLYYVLGNHSKTQARRAEVGSNYPAVNESDVRGFEVLCPPLPEQRRIAEVLDTLDEAIRKTEQVIAKLQRVKQGLLNDLLTRGIDEHGELRPGREDAPNLYRESSLGWIPAEWSVKSGQDVCRKIEVGIVVRPAQYYVPAGVPVLRSANVRENDLVMSDLVYMSEKAHLALAKSSVGPGDVLTVRTGYPGTTAVVPGNVMSANCVDIVISRPGAEIRPEFLSIWINSDYGKPQVLRVQGGLAQQHFNVGELKKLLVSLPPLSEQDRIIVMIAQASRRLSSEATEASKLRTLKQGLMDDLLTGRVRTVPSEPAP